MGMAYELDLVLCDLRLESLLLGIVRSLIGFAV